MEEEFNPSEGKRKPGYLKGLGEKLESGYSDDLWERIGTRIPKKRKRRFLIWWWFSGFLFLGLAGLGYFVFKYNSEEKPLSTRLANQEKSISENPGMGKHPFINEGNKASPSREKQALEGRTPENTEIESARMAENGSQEQSTLPLDSERPEKQIGGIKQDAKPIKEKPLSKTKKSTTKLALPGPENFKTPVPKTLKMKNPEGRQKKNQGLNLAFMTQTPTQKLREKKENSRLPSSRNQNPILKNEDQGNTISQNDKQPTSPKKEVEPKSLGNEKVSSLPVSVQEKKPEELTKSDSAVQNAKPIREELLVQKADSSKKSGSNTVAESKKDTTQKDLWRKPFLSLDFGFGSLFQQITLANYNSNTYAPGNVESNINNERIKPRPSILALLQGNWALPVFGNLQAGLRIRGGWMYQEVQTELLSGRYSSSNFAYGPDSLSFVATSNAETGTQIFKRSTLFADAGLLLGYKKESFPIGIAMHWPLVRYQQSHSGPEGANASGFQYILQPPDLRIWFSFSSRLDVYAESLMMHLGNFSLPLPIKNKGKNLGIQIGMSWKW